MDSGILVAGSIPARNMRVENHSQSRLFKILRADVLPARWQPVPKALPGFLLPFAVTLIGHTKPDVGTLQADLRSALPQATITIQWVSGGPLVIAMPTPTPLARLAIAGKAPDGQLVRVFDNSPLALAAVSAPEAMQRIGRSVLGALDGLPAEERAVRVETFAA